MRGRGQTGAIGELVVSIELMRRGYDVYRAINPDAEFDLVAVKDDAVTRVEVRSVARRKDGSLCVSMRSTDKCDLYAFVCRDEVVLRTPEEAKLERRFIRGNAI